MDTTPKDRPSNETPFQHQPLAPHYIRLVHLLPSPLPDSPIACDISIHHEDSCPEYETLSYTWGDVNDGTHDILLDGRRFTIRSNLCLFLKRLRREDTTRVIWADAICIDQSNIEERNHQVRSMVRIYRNAAKTLVWLGPGCRDSDLLLEIIQDIDKIINLIDRYSEATMERNMIDDKAEEHEKTLADLKEKMTQFRQQHDACIQSIQRRANLTEATEPQVQPPIWLQSLSKHTVIYPDNDVLDNIFMDPAAPLKVLSDLCKRPYWMRVWIIQEIVLSATIELFCGSKTTTWDRWCKMLYLCERSMLEHTRAITASTAMVLYREWERRHRIDVPSPVQLPIGSKGLEHILDKFEASLCSDVRDKVFGLLGLVVNPPLEPDYAKTPIELFSELLWLFQTRSYRENRESQRPPIYDLFHVGRLLQSTLRLDIHGPKDGAKTDEFGSILTVSGSIVGTVLAMVLNGPNHEDEGSALIDTWIRSMTTRPSTHSNLMQCIQGLKRILARHSGQSFGCVEYSQFVMNLSEPGKTNRILSIKYFPGAERGTPIKPKNPSVLNNSLCWFAHSRGSFGITDMHVEEGDLVCNCSGISPTHALILRESPTGLQAVGRAVISPIPFRNDGVSYSGKMHDQTMLDGQNLEVEFDATSLLALVLLPFP